MNNTELLNIFKNPELLSSSESEVLDKVVQEYPYFQAAHAVYLKALHTSKSYKYNQALKRTAAHTIDRNVLFEFITSKFFDDDVLSKEVPVEEIEVFDVETIQELHQKIVENLRAELLKSSGFLKILRSSVLFIYYHFATEALKISCVIRSIISVKASSRALPLSCTSAG